MTLANKFCLVALVFVLSACAHQQNKANINPEHFVSVEGRHFYLEGERYYFTGTNFWYGAYLGSPGETGDRERLIRELDALKANGITNLRVLAASENSELMRAVRPAVVQDSNGDLNRELLEGLDFLLAEMARRDMKAVLYLNNFWQWSGGMSQYVAWITGEPVVDPDVTGDWDRFINNSANFYRLPEAQNLYRDVIKKLVQRKNTLTGRFYYEDPTVMSWQLANEPRPGAGNFGPNFHHFKSWIHETAKYIHELAPHQLVSTGNEGAMGSMNDEDLYIIAHASPYVDYLTFHMWLKNWGWFDVNRPEETYDDALTNARAYMNAHIDIANKMNKPTVLSEFGAERDQGAFEAGTSTVWRDRIYRDVFDLIHQRASAGDAIAGTNFWTWGGYGRAGQADFMWAEGDDFTGDPPQEHQGLNSVFDTDASTIEVIKGHAEKMQRLD